MTPEGQARLIEHENEILYAYPDSKGFWTIGIGHLIDVRKGGAIPQRISRLLFEDDVARFTATARANLDWFDALDPVRQDVVVMLLFNMGLGDDRIGFRSFKLMIQAIKDKNWHEAAFQLANSDWARKDVGKDRKVALCNALETGRWTTDRVV